MNATTNTSDPYPTVPHPGAVKILSFGFVATFVVGVLILTYFVGKGTEGQA